MMMPPGLLGILAGAGVRGVGFLGDPFRSGRDEHPPEIMTVHRKACKTGSATCRCGRTISRNKNACFACSTSKGGPIVAPDDERDGFDEMEAFDPKDNRYKWPEDRR